MDVDLVEAQNRRFTPPVRLAMRPPSAPNDRRDAVALHPVDLQPATPAGKERRPELPLEVGLHLKELLAHHLRLHRERVGGNRAD